MDAYDNLKELFETKIVAAEKANLLAIKNLEIQLQNDKILRQIIHDQVAGCITKSEYNIHHEKIKDDISDLKETRAELKGKANMNSVYIGYVISIILFITAIVLQIYLKK